MGRGYGMNVPNACVLSVCYVQKADVSIKYHDPTYMVRSVPANADDSVYCQILAQNAVHGAMAGFTGGEQRAWAYVVHEACVYCCYRAVGCMFHMRSSPV